MTTSCQNSLFKWQMTYLTDEIFINRGKEFILETGMHRNCSIHRGHVALPTPPLTASGNVTSMRKPLDGSLWFYWIVAQEASQNGGCFENYHYLRYLFSLWSAERTKFFAQFAERVLRSVSRRDAHNLVI